MSESKLKRKPPSKSPKRRSTRVKLASESKTTTVLFVPDGEVLKKQVIQARLEKEIDDQKKKIEREQTMLLDMSNEFKKLIDERPYGYLYTPVPTMEWSYEEVVPHRLDEGDDLCEVERIAQAYRAKLDPKHFTLTCTRGRRQNPRPVCGIYFNEDFVRITLSLRGNGQITL